MMVALYSDRPQLHERSSVSIEFRSTLPHVGGSRLQFCEATLLEIDVLIFTAKIRSLIYVNDDTQSLSTSDHSKFSLYIN